MEVKKPKRLDVKSLNIINSRLVDEYTAHFFYREATNWCDNMGYVSAARYFEKEANDEMIHAQGLQTFATDHNVMPKLPIIKQIESFTSLVDIFNKQYEIEFDLGKEYQANMSEAKEDGNMYLFNLLQKYVQIQDESIVETSTRLNKLSLIDVNDKSWLYNFQLEEFEN